MPTVLTFWQMPEDEQDFIDFVEKTGDVVAIVDGTAQDYAGLEPVALRNVVNDNPNDSCLMGLRSQILKMGIKQVGIDGGVAYCISRNALCISYRGPVLRDGTLHMSNIVAEWNYLNEDQTGFIDKEPEFRQWAEKLFSWLRRRTPRKVTLWDYPYRATKRVADAVRDGDILVDM